MEQFGQKRSMGNFLKGPLMAAGLALSPTPEAHAEQKAPDSSEIVSSSHYTEAQPSLSTSVAEAEPLTSTASEVTSSIVEDFPKLNEKPASLSEAFTQYTKVVNFYGPESGMASQGFIIIMATLGDAVETNPNITTELAKLNLILKSNPSEEKFLIASVVLARIMQQRPLLKEEAYEVLEVIFEYPNEQAEIQKDLLTLFRKDQRETFDLVFHEDATPLEFMAGESSGDPFGQEDPELQHYLVDKTLIGLDKTAELIVQKKDETIRTYTERVVKIHRYLSFRGIEATTASIERAEQEIKEAQEAWGGYEIFSGHTLFVADDSDDGIDFTDRNSTQIKASSGSFELLHGSGTLESYEAVKREALEKIATTPGRINVIFSMHGLPTRISLGTVGEGQQEVSVDLIPEDIVEAIAKKYESESERTRAATEPDVIILANCYSGSFAMKIIEGLQIKKLPVPLIITSSEAGQLSKGNEERGIFFLDTLMKKDNPTISDIYGITTWELHSNPIVLTPDKNDATKPLQISELEQDSFSS